MGRPYAIDMALESDDLKTIETAAGYGLTQAMIAALLNISTSTFDHYKGNPDLPVAAALERGRAQIANDIGEALVNKAKGGDVAAIRWYEMTRQGRKEGVDHSGSVEVNHGVLRVPITEEPEAWSKRLAPADTPQISGNGNGTG